MILHLTFTDGSNPYVAFGDNKKIARELKKWQRKYDISLEEKEDMILGLVHVPKPIKIDLFSFE